VQWVVCPEGPDKALKSGKVDVWHILTDLPERHEFVYFTDPWLRMRFALAAPEHGPIKDARSALGRRLSYTNHFLQQRLARQFFPGSPLVPEAWGNELKAVCLGHADAAFIETKDLFARLLKRPSDCDGFAFTLIPLDNASYQVAIGAAPSGIAAAIAGRNHEHGAGPHPRRFAQQMAKSSDSELR
jgi:ABC-type amino acid transport substrate-binding protein